MAREPDIGEAWCLACGPQFVNREWRVGPNFRLELRCGHQRMALLVHHRGFRWVRPPMLVGHRVETIIVGPDGEIHPAKEDSNGH